MPDIQRVVTLQSKGNSAGPTYRAQYSNDCINYTNTIGTSLINLPSVGSTAIVTVPDTAICIRLVNQNASCGENNVVQIIGTTTTTSTSTTSTTSTTTAPPTTTTTTFSPDPCICTEVVITSAGGEVETFNCFGVNENYVYMNAGTYYICAASIGGLLQAFFAEGTTGTISPNGNCKTGPCPPATTTSTSTTSTSTTSTSTTSTSTTSTSTIAPFTACMSDFSDGSACSCDGLSYGTWTFYGSGNSICTSTTITSTGILSEIENNGFFWVASGGQVRYYQKNGTGSSATAQAACFSCPTTTTSTSTTTSTTTTPTTATFNWNYFESGGANGEMTLYINGNVVENRFSDSSGTYNVSEGDTISCEVVTNGCTSPNLKANAYCIGIINDATCADTSTTLTTSNYTVTAGNIGNTITLSMYSVCSSGCV